MAEAERAALPENLAAAQQLIVKSRQQIAKLRADLERSDHEIKWLRHRLDVRSRRLFGRKAEQLTPGQLVLAYEQLENETGKADEPVETDSGEGSVVGKRHRPRADRRGARPHGAPEVGAGGSAAVPSQRAGGARAYLLDGRLKPDNNGAENQLRVVAVGRKSWLFAGSHEGARRAAVLDTLAQGCKLVGIDPFRVLQGRPAARRHAPRVPDRRADADRLGSSLRLDRRLSPAAFGHHTRASG